MNLDPFPCPRKGGLAGSWQRGWRQEGQPPELGPGPQATNSGSGASGLAEVKDPSLEEIVILLKQTQA